MAGYGSTLESVKDSSPYVINGKRDIKRVSELKMNPNAEGANPENIRAYEENNFLRHMGWEKGIPPTVEIYRGVSRADAKLRPGEYVTTNRSLARGYIRGNYGRIIRETVPTDDLVIMKLDDWEYPEFLYYPRSAQNEQSQTKEINVPFTFREFYNQVNSRTANNFNWYKKSIMASK